MASREEAKEHIDSFWTRRHISRDSIDIENDINLRDLSNGLKMFSHGLYDDLNHFFWELLQNADDSKYGATQVPRVDFVLSGRELKYETNEIGFTRVDVESLCAVGCSSKAGQNDTIGEKGVGFKSLFKIADVVTIHSGFYAFELGTRPPLGDLGMILPIWLDKSEAFSTKTSISLHLKADLDISKLCQHMTSFDFTFLLFTRKIKEICFKMPAGLGHSYVNRGWLEYMGPNSERIRTEIEGGPQSTMEYATFRSKYHSMPPRHPEAKDHSDSDATEIVLAFPHKDHQPIIAGQMTYAFLPVSYFGFQFIIHADFVLTLHRTSIDNNLIWNLVLWDLITKQLCLAIQHLATSSESKMRFGWAEYLGSLWSIYNPFMRGVADSTAQQLQSKPLVLPELQDGTFRAPQDSLTLPGEFRDENGDLLITEGRYALQVRSNDYSEDSGMILSKLGVSPFGIAHFVELLDQYISAHSASLSSKTPEWHSRVARIICNHFPDERYHSCSRLRHDIKALRIIPLDDGSWVSGDFCASRKVFFDRGRRIALSAGLDFRFVEASAANDSYRRQLYQLLGVKPCDETEVCEMILESHRTMIRSPPLGTLISHAVYIFRARFKPGHGQSLRLRLADSNLTVRYQDRVHLPFGTQDVAVKLFAGDFTGIIWLHPDYETGVTEGERQNWLQFLQSLEGVHSLPPLHSGGRLSPAMIYILVNIGSKEFLRLLKTQYYSGYRDMLTAWKSSALLTDISNAEVSTDQGKKKLCQSILPAILPSLSSVHLDFLPVLQIFDPTNADWSFLHEFGVQTELSPEFFVKQLRDLKKSDDQTRVKAAVPNIYKALTACQASDSSKLVSIHDEKLIFVNSGGWVCPQQCVWRASFSCKKVHILSRLYPGCDNLFQNLLKVRDAGLDDLISELEAMESARELDQIRLLRQKMLPALESFLSKASLSAIQRSKLLGLHIFPTTHGDPDDLAQPVKLLRAQDTFWIADLNFLRAKFEGVVPLLDVTGKLFKSSMRNVFGKLSMDSKLLSLCVQKEENQPDQDDTRELADPALTNRLRRQSRYIIGIVCHENKLNQRIDHVTAMLSNIRVFRVPDITIRRYVLDASTKRYGRDETGEVLLLDVDAELHVKLRRDSELTDIIVPLSERFAERFNLGNAGRELLLRVLTTEKAEQFLEGLEKAGIKIDLTPVAEVVAEDNLDEDFDDATLAEDPDDSLGLAFRNLQISNRRTGNGSDEESLGSRQLRPAQTPNSHRRRGGADSGLSSPSTLRRWTGNATSSGARFDAIGTNGETATDENVTRLAASLSNTTLSDTTHDVFLNWSAPPRASLRAEPSEPSMPIFGMATAFEFTFNSPSFQRPENDQDAGVSGSVFPNTSTVIRGSVDNGSEAQPNSDVSHSSPNPPFRILETPTKASRRSNISWSSGQTPRNNYGGDGFVTQVSSEDVSNEVGSAGEHLVYKFLEDKLSPLFKPKHWTSRYRAKVLKIPFDKEFREKNFADFTYPDTDGRLTAYLNEHIPNFEGPTGQGNNITYHLEVKSTMGSLHTPALLSNNQISLAKKYSGVFSTPATQTDVYILVRVYGLGSDPPQPQFCLFPDPWNLICQGSLLIEGESGIYVQPNVS